MGESVKRRGPAEFHGREPGELQQALERRARDGEVARKPVEYAAFEALLDELLQPDVGPAPTGEPADDARRRKRRRRKRGAEGPAEGLAEPAPAAPAEPAAETPVPAGPPEGDVEPGGEGEKKKRRRRRKRRGGQEDAARDNEPALKPDAPEG